MDFKKLIVFCKVYELRSFSKAAKEVYLTQPSISGYIASLEDFFATRLFDRKGREVVPTPAGKLFYHHAKRILQLWKDLEKEMDLLLKRKKGDLKVGGSTIPGQYILPKLLGQFKKIYPEAKIELKIGDTQQIIESVLEGEIELGVVGAKMFDSNLVFLPFVKDELVFIVHHTYPLVQQKKISFAELKKIPFIMRESGSGTRRTLENFLKKKNIEVSELNVVAELGSTEAIRQAVLAGLGASIVSKRAVDIEKEAGLIKIFTLEKPLIRRFYLVYQKGKTLSPLAQGFLEIAKTYQTE